MIHELKGLFFEDYQVGDRFESPARTITEADIVNFAGLSGDFNPIHTDDGYARDTIFGSRIAHGMLTLCTGFGLYTRLGAQIGTGMGHLGISVRFTRAVRPGDTIRFIGEVSGVRPTSKPDRGIVTLDINIVNQDGETVVQGETVHMIRRRGS